MGKFSYYKNRFTIRKNLGTSMIKKTNLSKSLKRSVAGDTITKGFVGMETGGKKSQIKKRVLERMRKKFGKFGFSYTEKQKFAENIARDLAPETRNEEDIKKNIEARRRVDRVRTGMGGAVAHEISAAREKKTGENRKEERINRAILSKNNLNTKASYADIGIVEEKRATSALVSSGDSGIVEEKRATSAQIDKIKRKNKDAAGGASIINPKNATGITGLSAPNRGLGGSVSSSNRPNIPMASN